MSERIPARIVETIDPSRPIRLTPAQAGGLAELPGDAIGLCDLLVRTLADEVVGDATVERRVPHAAAH